MEELYEKNIFLFTFSATGRMYYYSNFPQGF